MSKPKEAVFLRQTSGLVRRISTTDALLFNIYMISVGGALTSLFLILLALNPGTDGSLSFFLWTYVFIIPSFCWGMMASIFPRSGGDYVYNTRILTPFTGFIVNWMLVIWTIFFSAFFAYWTSITGFGTAFFTYGLVFDVPWLLDASLFFVSTNGIFITGTLVLLFYFVMVVLPPKVYFTFQKATFIPAIVGLVVAFIAFAITPQDKFMPLFNSVLEPIAGANYYQQVIDAAGTTGFVAPTFSWNAVWWSLNLIAMANAITWYSAYFGSEIKKVEKSQIISIPGAAIIVGTMTGIGAFLQTRTAGADFLHALAFQGYIMGDLPQGMPIDIFFYPFMGSVIFRIPVLVALMCLSNIIWQPAYIMACVMPPTRSIVAWSMDRLVPGWFGGVNRKFSTPHNAALVVFVLGDIFLAIYTYTTWLTYASGLFFLMLSTFFVSIAATILPWRLPDIFDASPIGKYKVGRIPLMSIVGAASFVVSFFILYQYAVYTPAGFNTMVNLQVATIILVAGLVVYAYAKVVSKRRGIDLSVAYREVPPV